MTGAMMQEHPGRPPGIFAPFACLLAFQRFAPVSWVVFVYLATGLFCHLQWNVSTDRAMDAITCTAAIRACEKNGMLGNSLAVSSRIVVDRIEKDAIACNATVCAYEKDEMRGETDTITCGAAISASGWKFLLLFVW